MATIYLSSTYEDLKDYRGVVFEALRKSGDDRNDCTAWLQTVDDAYTSEDEGERIKALRAVLVHKESGTRSATPSGIG